MSVKQLLCNLAFSALPPTRAYRLKSWLLRFVGADVSPSARVVSSMRMWGDIALRVGDETFIGHQVLITGGASRVLIGCCVDIAPRVTIATGTHEIDMVGSHSAGAGYSQDITIEDGVWIGAGATILGGVTIGKKAVIAAGSVVTTDIPAYSLAAGVPCLPKKIWSDSGQEWSCLEGAQVL